MFFGSKQKRDMRKLMPIIDEINAYFEEYQSLSEEELARQDRRVPQAPSDGRDARRPAARGVRRGQGGLPPPSGPEVGGRRHRDHLGHGPLRRAACRRHRAAPGQDRRDGHRRGQDARRHPAAVPERPDGQGRPPGHGQRLPGPARQRVDGRDLPVPGHDRRLPGHDRAQHRRAPRDVPLRHHLRHQQRVRLRLPARQHGAGRRRSWCAARLPLRHRRRGGQHPHRRGAHAAHHLRPGGPLDAPLRRDQADRLRAGEEAERPGQPHRRRGRGR